MSLVLGARPVLVDAGSGSAHARGRIEALLAAEGLRVDDLQEALLTHAHDDHVGGAAWLQSHGVSLALHEADLHLACDRELLAFDVEPFAVDRVLRDGEVVPAGDRELHVVHVPSQMPGHVAFWEPRDRVLFSGDLLQDGDVAWVRWFEPDGVERAVAAIHRLAALEPRLVVPGHGPVIRDVRTAVAQNLSRYAGWADDPVGPARHAASRAAVQTLVHRPRTRDELAALPWARHLGGPLLTATLDRLLARGVLRDDAGVLHATVPAEPR